MSRIVVVMTFSEKGLAIIEENDPDLLILI